MLRSVPLVRPKLRGNKHQIGKTTGSIGSLSLERKHSTCSETAPSFSENDTEDGPNAIPLPPRDRTRSLLVGKPRHERKHPLIIPTAIAQAISQQAQQEPTYLEPLDDPPPENLKAQDSLDVSATSANGCDDKADNDVFEENIANKFDLLDQMEDKQRHSSASSPAASDDEAEDPVQLQDLEDHLAIMAKVLGNKVSEEDCIVSLRAVNNDVHRAIKLARSLLPSDADAAVQV
ncbi:Tyrosine-protein kinase PR2 [Nesidiocoris tenuis]|uniref:Tyrosine-protein kinase PR2 n=1 Tax=Nesidiocoris tenuis TaxID=355587 RepID=A0ABN7B6K1_9HEMI|nr:Tyrosine-protein kinase PR2 [Nesidiocoris tenuis]